jgi:uncharacterized membrane protein
VAHGPALDCKSAKPLSRPISFGALAMMNDASHLRAAGWWARLRRPRLTSGVLISLAVYAILLIFTSLSWRIRFIAAWDIGVSFVLVALFVGLRKSSAETIKRRALLQDTGKWTVLILSLFAATASLVVIASEMPLVKNAIGFEQIFRVVFVVFTIILSWAFMHTMFALHYAHDFYVDADLSTPESASQRLVFPGCTMPMYGDFLYFSFTVGMTFQVSDVQITDTEMRRVALLHGATSFFYTTGILALAINLVAGLI